MDQGIATHLKNEGYSVEQNEEIIAVQLGNGYSITFDENKFEETKKIKIGKLNRNIALALSVVAYLLLLKAIFNSLFGVVFVVLGISAIFFEFKRYKKAKEGICKIEAFYEEKSA